MHCKSYSHFFSKKFQHICVSLDVNFNESLTDDVVSFEQLGPDCYHLFQDPNQHAPEFKIPETDYTLRVKDTIVDREVFQLIQLLF